MGKSIIKEKIVISAVNFFEGGPLTILKDNLKFANDFLSDKYDIIALIHDKKLFDNKTLSKITFLEFPNSRKSYFIRIYLEYFHFKKLSLKLNPFLWFSLHDITPNVSAKVRVVYCHNPTPFKTVSLRDLFFQPTIFMFSLFYKFLYAININKNDFVVVQQIWIKKVFLNLFKLKNENVLVCYPKSTEKKIKLNRNEININTQNETDFIFFYPALARPFKNHEVIGEAVKILKDKGILNFKVIITINGFENKYSKHIYKLYKNLNNLKFIGNLSFSEVQEYYEKSNALLFSSTLETWGLPITEYKFYNKPILLSNLPYAFETLGDYQKGVFFDPNNSKELAQKMEDLMKGVEDYYPIKKISDEVLIGWEELYDKILKK